MDGMILKRGGDPSKLKTIDEHYTATEGQTEFPIAYETFDYLTDTVFVTSGRTTLSEGLDYTVESQKVVLMEGVPEGRTISIRIMKNTNTDAQDAQMSGVYIKEGTIPLDRLAEIPTAESIGAVKEVELPTKIQSLLTGGEISMVKKVQRGFTKITTNVQNVTISAVNPDKAFLMIQHGGVFNPSANYADARNVMGRITSSTNLEICTYSASNYYVAWEVIEYY